jgi:hypothetical protein
VRSSAMCVGKQVAQLSVPSQLNSADFEKVISMPDPCEHTYLRIAAVAGACVLQARPQASQWRVRCVDLDQGRPERAC